MIALTQERLKELLDYDAETGVFKWRVARPGQYAGRVANARNGAGYIVIRVDTVLYRAHRLAWFYTHGEWPISDLDHINEDKIDNRLANLRIATRSQNMSNVRHWKHNTSGFKGVSYHPECRKWYAGIKKNRRRIYLGLFATPEEASAAYQAAAAELHGEFASAD